MIGGLAGLVLPALSSWRVALFGVAALVVVGGVGFAVHHMKTSAFRAGQAEVQGKWDEDVRQRTEAFAALTTSYRLREQQMNADQAAARQEKERDKARLGAAQRRIADLLRNRPQRPADMSRSPAAVAADQGGPQCTGAGLFKPDAEFLAGQTARADDTRIALKECYAWHDSVMKALTPDAPR